MQSRVFIAGFTGVLVAAIGYTNVYLPTYSPQAQERRRTGTTGHGLSSAPEKPTSQSMWANIEAQRQQQQQQQQQRP
jgi:hypothetical protein